MIVSPLHRQEVEITCIFILSRDDDIVNYKLHMLVGHCDSRLDRCGREENRQSCEDHFWIMS